MASLPLPSCLCQLTAAKSLQDNSAWPSRHRDNLLWAAGGRASKQVGRVQNGGSGWDFPVFTPLAVTADTELSYTPFGIQIFQG